MATPNDILLGMKIIKKYATRSEMHSDRFQAQHDQVWCGSYTGHKMPPDDKEKMDILGWFEHEGAWSKFT